MSEYFQFFYKHIELSIAFLTLLLLILWEELGSKRFSTAGINPQTLVNFMNHQDALVLDIREVDAFKQEHIIDALNIPTTTLESNLKKLIKYKNSPIIIVDDKGQTSIRMLNQLKKHQFQKLYILSGGLTAWKQAGLPVIKSAHKR